MSVQGQDGNSISERFREPGNGWRRCAGQLGAPQEEREEGGKTTSEGCTDVLGGLKSFDSWEIRGRLSGGEWTVDEAGTSSYVHVGLVGPGRCDMSHVVHVPDIRSGLLSVSGRTRSESDTTGRPSPKIRRPILFIANIESEF